jgi:hypothetical protein
MLIVKCGGFEVPPIFAARSERNFKSKSHTIIIELPVSLLIPKFATSKPQTLANFGIGTLADRPHMRWKGVPAQAYPTGLEPPAQPFVRGGLAR